ncbi:MAG: hypothetical protein ACYCZ6_16515 [Polaromonas sp.]
MPKSLLEQLPEIVKRGREEAEKILENLESRHRVTLQTREVVLPAKDSAAIDWVTSQNRAAQREVFAPSQVSLLANAQATLGADSAIHPEPWQPPDLRRQPAGHGRAAGGRRAHAVPARQGGSDLHRPAVRQQGRLPHQGDLARRGA